MPTDSKVAKVVRGIMRSGKSKRSAIRIAQKQTGQSYKTGRKSKRKGKRKRKR
jgi:hypothetical protein